MTERHLRSDPPTSSEIAAAVVDVEAAIDWLQTQPDIDKKHIALIGESFGANVALRYAAINEDLSAVAVFSPGLNYRGVRTDDVIRQLGQVPFHIFVSQNDDFAFKSSKRLVEIRQESGIDRLHRQFAGDGNAQGRSKPSPNRAFLVEGSLAWSPDPTLQRTTPGPFS